MPLSVGVRLGPYEIVAAIGAGGMGEVYRARDTRLDRMVAIKVLPAHLSSAPDLKRRFEREARTISALNHPHICTLHDIGSQDGVDFLVMEYLEGETLADRLRRGRLPMDQLAKIGCEISSALDAAHSAGIVHRDLKPGNVMLVKSGAKLMDFGLAKLAVRGAAENASAPLLSAAVTVTRPGPQASPLTMAGSLLGTVQYMSPEQVEGREADARSDIFALGAVLYEMATGRRAFEGKSQLSVASAILEKEPEPLSSVEPSAPPALEDIVRICLAKDPDERYASAHDIQLQLRRAVRVMPVLSQDRGKSRWLIWAVAVLLLAAVALLATSLLRRQERTLVSAEILAPPATTLDLTGEQAAPPVLSPDGRLLVVGAAGRLWLRQTGAGTYSALEGTSGAAFPFWSPDSLSIGFFANAKLQTMDVRGGAPVTVCAAQSARGGAWGRDNVIVFAPSIQTPLSKVPAAGGTPVAVTSLNTREHSTHRWPFFLPDGQHFIYLAANHNDNKGAANGIYLGSVDGKENRRLMHATSNAIYSSGYLLFVQDGELLEQRFDARALKLAGEPVRLRRRIFLDGGVWRNVLSASDTGLLLYLSGSADLAGRIRWVSETGKPLATLDDVGAQNPRLSPDGKKIAVEKGDLQSDIWIYDVAGPVRVRFTATGRNFSPVWSPDGKQLLFTSIGGSATTSPTAHMMIGPISGGGNVTAVNPSDVYQNPTDWSRDGKFILFQQGDTGVSELWATEVRAGSTPFPLVKSLHQSHDGRFSPDGKWVAFTSRDTGQFEVYVTPFPGPGPRLQISTGGGSGPRWRQDGREIYFYRTGGVMAVSINTAGSEARVGNPRKLFQATIGTNTFNAPAYDVTPDGKKFVIYSTEDLKANQSPLNLVVNWDAPLKQ